MTDFDIPEDCRYLDTHEWARPQDDAVRVGITDFAQDELGDVVFVELPDEGEALSVEASFGVVESIKAVSDLYAPVGGTVGTINEALFDAPELVNEDPYGEGWMLEIEDPTGFEQLLSREEYADTVA
jgi:glycine cleavage system H protein